MIRVRRLARVHRVPPPGGRSGDAAPADGAPHPAPRRPSVLDDDAGVGAVEFALMLPILAVLVMGVTDFGAKYHAKLKLMNAATVAAQYAVNNGANVGSSTAQAYMANVKAVATSMANLSTAPIVTVSLNDAADATNAGNYYCLTGAPPTWTSTGTSSLVCSTLAWSGKFVTITLSTSYRSFFAGNPILSPSSTLSETVIARIQ